MSVPPGLYPPLLTVDESHRGAWIAVSGAIGLTLSIFSLLVRVYVRAVISPPFSKDDVVFFAAMVSISFFYVPALSNLAFLSESSKYHLTV